MIPRFTTFNNHAEQRIRHLADIIMKVVVMGRQFQLIKHYNYKYTSLLRCQEPNEWPILLRRLFVKVYPLLLMQLSN